MSDDARRFWKYVPQGDPSQCWEWQSTISTRGYGKFWLNGKTLLAHRVSYELNNGPIPSGHHVRHTCDNKPCVNPAHLLTGTAKDNCRDAMERGQVRRGIDNGTAKLTNEQVGEIKTCWANGETQVSMARRFGVSRAAVQWVLNGRSWSHVGAAS